MATLVLNPKITKAGLAIMPNQSGMSVTLTHIAIGTGKYAMDTAAGNRVALAAEVARYPISSGTNPTPTSVQTGVTITDTDPQGRSPNGLAIGEIGWFVGNTLWAVWSRADSPLFVKSAQFDVPFAYTFDISTLPENSVTVTVATDPAGMAALINQHKAEADPHPGYVLEARGIGDYAAGTSYAIGAKVTGPDNKTYRSIVNSNIGNTPAANPTKWERWGHSVQEMADEFVPERTAIAAGAAALGMLRVSNPGGANYAFVGQTTGALRVVFPNGTQAVESYIRMAVEVFELAPRRSMTVIIAGRVSGNAWDANVSASILSDQPDRQLPIRFGNDGTKPCIMIGDATATWFSPRVHVSDFMVTANPSGGDKALWSTGWAVAPVTALGVVSQTVTNSLVFARTDVDRVAGLAELLASKQGILNFMPVQQGGGIGQLTNKVYMGWSGGGLKVTVDSTDLGALAFLDSPGFTGAPTAPTVTAAAASDLRLANTAFVQAAIKNAQIGQIHFEARTSPRAGFLIANGAVLSRAAYPDLWAYAQSSGAITTEANWGASYWGCFTTGDGSTNFRIPLLLGEFIRCWDGGRGADAGRTIGTYQGPQNLSHSHPASSVAVGDHLHSAWTDIRGWHGHHGGTAGAGGHNHNNGGYTRLLRAPYGGSLTGGDTNGSGSEQAVGNGDSADIVAVGDHGHIFDTDGNGNHDHGVGIGGAGNHAHTISVGADYGGGGEARPRNIALTPMLRAF
jgi:hypothetical protein